MYAEQGRVMQHIFIWVQESCIFIGNVQMVMKGKSVSWLLVCLSVSAISDSALGFWTTEQ